MFHIFHKWKTVVSDGRYLYQQCKKCPKRRIVRKYGIICGYQPEPPICEEWIETGIFKYPPKPKGPPPPPPPRMHEVRIVREDVINKKSTRPPRAPLPPPCRLIREGHGPVPVYDSTYATPPIFIEKELEAAGVIKKGNFKLRSGKTSTFYIDKDKIYGNDRLFKNIIDYMALEIIFKLSSSCFDVIVGPETGGIVLASPLAYKFGKKFAFAKKLSDNKMILRGSYVDVVKRKRVLIVDDILTTGGSIKRTMDAVAESKGQIAGVMCIWNRGDVRTINGVVVHSLVNKKID